MNMMNPTSCPQMYELPQSHLDDNWEVIMKVYERQEGTSMIAHKMSCCYIYKSLLRKA